jgi:acyl-CoA hydrolase
MATAVAPPDSQGNLSLSLHAGATVDELRRCGEDPARLLVAEVNPSLPRTLGLPPDHPHCLHVDEVDLLVESDRPVFTLDDAPATEEERAIAEFARPYLKDGSTLQTGIGGISNAIVSLLAEGEGGDYGIHSEMFTTGLMRLHQAGKVTNHKGIYDGVSIATFAFGSAELYRWLDGQKLVRFLPVHAVNTPSVISQNRKMVSINGALAVDLAGQLVADTLGGEQYSGIGGHEDFVSGAALAPEGRSRVCMPSIARRGEGMLSRILPFLAAGTMVTTPRHQVDVIITEYGAAELAGRTVEERKQALIAIAHPDVRDALAAGREIGPDDFRV